MGYSIDLTGQRFGRLVVTRFIETKKHLSYWECLCDCGNIKAVCTGHLRSGKTNSCGCLRDDLSKGRTLEKSAQFTDLTGKKFGKLTAICIDEEKTSGATRSDIYWKCICDCGVKKSIRGRSLRHGDAKTCGKCEVNKSKETHGKTNTRLFNTWSRMRVRCSKEYDKGYKNYGGRGIKVCDEWINDFQAFYDWAMANGYADNLSIDRINNDGNYEPSNCRWATAKEQVRNRRVSNGENINHGIENLPQICEERNMSYFTVYNRLRHGWGLEKALSVPEKG